MEQIDIFFTAKILISAYFVCGQVCTGVCVFVRVWIDALGKDKASRLEEVRMCVRMYVIAYTNRSTHGAMRQPVCVGIRVCDVSSDGVRVRINVCPCACA